jgi:hypothetical protein
MNWRVCALVKDPRPSVRCRGPLAGGRKTWAIISASEN